MNSRRGLMRRSLLLAACAFAIPLPASRALDGPREAHWPQFRGPAAAGVAEGKPLAVKWDTSSGENILWKAPTPGLGYSAPAIWGDKIFLTTAVGQSDPKVKVGLYGNIEPVVENFAHQFKLLCLDRATGKLLWEQTACEGVPKIKRHPKGSHANCTPAVDAERVVAFYGAEGLFCFDHAGKLLWKKDLGKLDSGYYVVPTAQWGFASSPVLHDGKVIVLADVQSDSFLAVFDAKTGHEIWRVAREDVPTWGTPTIARVGDRTHVLVNGYKHSGAYDLADGRQVWRLNGGGDIPVPTPVVAHDLVYLTSAHGPLAPISAVNLSATGEFALPTDNTGHPHVAWSNPRRGNYMQTPLVYRDLLFLCMDNGMATCFDARNGDQKWRKRLGEGSSGFTASPVAGDGKIYYSSEDGDIYVVKTSADYELLAKNSMGEVTMATPAIAEGVLYIRTQNHLWAIGKK